MTNTMLKQLPIAAKRVYKLLIYANMYARC